MHLEQATQVIFCSLMLESHHSRLLASSQGFAIRSGGMLQWETAKLREMCSIIPQDTSFTTNRNAYCSHEAPHHNPPAVNFQIPPSSTSHLYVKAHLRSAPPLEPSLIPQPWCSNSTTNQSTNLYLPFRRSLLEKGLRRDTHMHMVLGAQIHLFRPATKCRLHTIHIKMCNISYGLNCVPLHSYVETLTPI